MNRGKRRAQFYREVLDPVDIEEAETNLREHRKNREYLSVTGNAQSYQRVPFADRIGRLREFTGRALATAMTNRLAKMIVEEFLWMREEHQLGPKTLATYTKKSVNLLKRYHNESGSEDGPLSPVVAVECLFEHSKRLSPASWDLYRSSLLFAFRKTRETQIRREKEHEAYDRAIAILAVVDEPPHADERPAKSRADRRTGVPTVDYMTVLEYLEDSTVNRSDTARIFAMATMETGLRMDEWGDAQLLEPDFNDDQGRPQLRIHTSKGKQGTEDTFRTLVLATPEVESLVRWQLANVRLEIDDAPAARRVPPLENLTRKCSERIMDACRKLWPKNPKRWFTLYTLRHQASANLKRIYGNEVAAAMLGHGVVVGRRNYAPKQRASRGCKSAVGPGPDVSDRATAMLAAKAVRNSQAKPWKHGGNENRAENSDVGDIDDDPGEGDVGTSPR